MLRCKALPLASFLSPAAVCSPMEHFADLSVLRDHFRRRNQILIDTRSATQVWGHEIAEPVSPNGFKVWMNPTMTLESLDSIELDEG